MSSRPRALTTLTTLPMFIDVLTDIEYSADQHVQDEGRCAYTSSQGTGCAPDQDSESCILHTPSGRLP